MKGLSRVALVIVALGLIVWLFLGASPDRPTTYSSSSAVMDSESDDTASQQPANIEDRTAKRELIEHSLREKAARF